MSQDAKNPVNTLIRSIVDAHIVWDTGTVKWFDPVRRFGFIVPDEPGPDVFLPWTVLQECAIRERDARPGIAVRFRWVPPDHTGHRPQVTHLILVKQPPRK